MELYYINRIMLHDVNGITRMACHYTALIKIFYVNGNVTLMALCYINGIILL